jgi:ribosomal protein S18 acetylase RimI-like enzyme
MLITALEPISLRIADEDDCADLCPLYWAFHEFHVQHLPDRLRSLGPVERYDCATLQATLTQLVISSEADLVIARTPAAVIGFAEVQLRQDEAHPARVSHRYGHLTGLYVAEAYQRQGIGAGLVQRAEHWAKQRGATEMRLEVWAYAGSSLAFYEQMDYRTLSRTLVKGW